jgi:hypothetical protein
MLHSGIGVNTSGVLQDDVQFNDGDRRTRSDRRSGAERRGPAEGRPHVRTVRDDNDRRSGTDRRDLRGGRSGGLLDRLVIRVRRALRKASATP